MNCLEEIRCEIIPIPNSSSVDPPKHALFFHRFHERGTESSPVTGVLSCSTAHNREVVAVQCLHCSSNALQVKQSDHQSKKCCHSRFKHTFELVSWFDERIEVVLPTGRHWLNRLGCANIFVPLADNTGFSFSLVRAVLDHLGVALFANDVTVADLTIQRLNLSPRCVMPVAGLKHEVLGITNKISRAGSFSVLTYNLLSDIYLYPERRMYCPQWALTWEYRRRNLLHEIVLYNADVVCLQEVQSDHFENYFKPELATFGYSAVYKKKTAEVYTGNGYTMDGCATFFRTDMFKEIVAYELEYSKTALSLIWKLEPSLRDQARVRFIKDNVALALVLEIVGNATTHAESQSRLCVVNTHIHASIGSPDVKLLQVSDLISEIEKIIDPRMPVFICGDINSIPGSEPYTLLVRGELNSASRKEMIDPFGIHRHLKLHHSMKLESAYTSAYAGSFRDTYGQNYNSMDWRGRKPSFTSLTPNRRSTLDYIFYTVDSVEVEGLLELLDIDLMERALPSPLWSSDHIALMAKFRITKPILA